METHSFESPARPHGMTLALSRLKIIDHLFDRHRLMLNLLEYSLSYKSEISSLLLKFHGYIRRGREHICLSTVNNLHKCYGTLG